MDPVGLARVGLFALAAAAPFFASAARGDAAPAPRIELVCDLDDDDGDGVPDGEQAFLPPAARVDLVAMPGNLAGARVRIAEGSTGDARLVVDGRPRPFGEPLGGAASLEGLRPGLVKLAVERQGKVEALEAYVSGVGLRDGTLQRVDMTRSHASIERTPPARVEGGVDQPYDDPDALRIVLETDHPRDVSIESLGSDGKRIDVLGHVPMQASACHGAASACFASDPIRLAMDDVDRAHPLVRGRSVRAEVGGAVAVWLAGKKAQQIRVLGPRTSPAGPLGAYAATLRLFVFRVVAGGAPAIGGTEPAAVQSARAELGAAAAIWGQCGVTFGNVAAADVKIVDPPPPYLVAIGDGLGLVASGGVVDLVVDGKPVTAAVLAGASPDRVADDVARAIERAGFSVTISPNARIGPGVSGSVDLLVRRKDGAFAVVEGPPGGKITGDATLTVRIGSIELSDGLEHFTDIDAMAGTLEERTLLKAVDDGDPTTIEVVVVPMFTGGGRIGESFIGSDLSSLRNVVLLDRAGIRARRSSLTLAHELGHVLMDIPGHPDDYGVDTPTMLMDSDASDASPFGPRRLSVEDCARVVRQSGPGARVPLLVPVALRPLVVTSPRPPVEEAP